MIQIESALQENSRFLKKELHWSNNLHFSVIWKCSDGADIMIHYPEKSSFDCCWSLWIKKVNCANKYFSVTWMGPINAVNWRDCCCFLNWQKEALSTPQLVNWCCFLLHWVLRSRGWCYLLPGTEDTGCFYWYIFESFSDRLVGPMLATTFFSPKKAKRNKKGDTKAAYMQNVLLALICC